MSVTSVVPLLLIGAFSYFWSLRAMENQFRTSMLETLNQVDLNLSKRLERITDISDTIIANTELNDLLSPTGGRDMALKGVM